MTDHSRLVSAIPERASFSAYRPDLRPSVAFVKRWSGSLLGYACCNWRPPTSGLRTWTADGTCERILDHVVVKDDSVGNVEWTIGVDSSNVRAHQHSTGPGKGGCATDWAEALAVDGEALGRSRCGLTSKIHLAVDGRGLPMSIIPTSG